MSVDARPRFALLIRVVLVRLRLAAQGPWTVAERIMSIAAIAGGLAALFWPAPQTLLDTYIALISGTVFLLLLAIRVLRPRYRDSVTPPTGRAGRTFRLTFTGLLPDELMTTSFMHPDGYMKVETFRNKTPSEGIWDLRVGTGGYSPPGEYVYRVAAGGVVKELRFQIVERGKGPDSRSQMPFVPGASNPPAGGPDTMFLVMFAGLSTETLTAVDVLMPSGSTVRCGHARANPNGSLRIVYYSGVPGQHTIRATQGTDVKEIGLTLVSVE